MIQIPIEIGDTILAGRFKNKKITVREIGLDDFGLPTINGRGILKIRIPKLYVKENTMAKIDYLDDVVKPMHLKQNQKYVSVQGASPKNVTYIGRGTGIEYKFEFTDGQPLVLSPKDVMEYIKQPKVKSERLSEGSTDSIPVKIKKEDDRYFIYVQYPDETEKCITNVGFESEDLALHSATTKGYTLVGDKKNKFTEPPKAMTQRSNEFKLSESSLNTLKRLVMEVLNEVDVTDPKIEAAIDELSKLQEQLSNATAQIDALKKQLGVADLEKKYKKIVDEQLWDFLDELKKDGDRIARTKNVLLSVDRVQTTKATYEYEKVVDYAMTQVNQDVQYKILQELKLYEKITKVKPALSFSPRTENKLTEENIFQKVGNFLVKNIQTMLGKLKSKGQKIDNDLTKLERILKIS